MSYIIFVQPAVLSGSMLGVQTGMDFGAVTAATCFSAALASALMGLVARYPIAQAPGMGQNFFFVLTAIPAATAAGFSNAWQVALGAVFLSGVLFMILSLAGTRAAVMDAISPTMKHGIVVGIGLFIAFIGLQNAGLILKDPGTGVKLNPHFDSPDLWVFFFGFTIAAVLYSRRVQGALLWGMAGAAGLAALLPVRFSLTGPILSAPPSLAPTLLKMDVIHALSAPMIPITLIFLFMVLFDTMGTLIGVCEQAGFIKDNKLPRANRALFSDAAGTTLGAVLGTSTVTSYVESAAGVEQGGRTGLTALTVSILFLLALFLNPLVRMVGSYPPITAPALVLVGFLMARSVVKIDWADFTEAIPAFLILLGVPLSYSIADGLTLGFISYPVIKFLAGRGRQVNGLMAALAAVLLLYFLFVRSRIG